MKRTFGVDVSHWEGRINWHMAAGAIGFAYFKCTDGIRFIDEQYANNSQGCAEAGIPHAPYHYFQPSLDPIAQADHFIGIAGKHYQKYILDLEEPERDPMITEKVAAFLGRVEILTNSRPAIYTSAGYWRDFIFPQPRWAGEYDLIVAHYTAGHSPILPRGWNSYVIWQFSDYWSFPGCDEDADANWFNGNMEQCRDWFGNYHLPARPAQGGLRMRSLFGNLRIRQSPSIQARIIGKLAKNEFVDVTQVEGSDVWVRHERGWSCVEKNGYRYMEIQK